MTNGLDRIPPGAIVDEFLVTSASSIRRRGARWRGQRRRRGGRADAYCTARKIKSPTIAPKSPFVT
jgi:hypothetical protein